MHQSESETLLTQTYKKRCRIVDYSKVRRFSERMKGFTLVELLIALTIVGILLALAVPIYRGYSAKAKFSEVVQAIGPYKTAADLAVQTEVTALSELDAGANGIPDAVTSDNTYYEYISTINLVDGVLTATARGINSGDEPTYILNGNIDSEGLLTWEVNENSTCLVQNLC